MRKVLILLKLCFFSHLLFGQTCKYQGLSNELDFKVEMNRIAVPDYNDSCTIMLTVINKSTNKKQTIQLTSTYLLDSVFEDCNAVRSYTTKKNINGDVVDNDYGDLIIADFNFDSKEDIAIKRSSGGTGGPYYNFYIQDLNGNFIRNSFLSEKMEFFPTKISKETRTLVTYAHAGACWVGEHVFYLNEETGVWKERRRRIINVCKK